MVTLKILFCVKAFIFCTCDGPFPDSLYHRWLTVLYRIDCGLICFSSYLRNNAHWTKYGLWVVACRNGHIKTMSMHHWHKK